MTKFRAGCVQLCSGFDIGSNMDQAERLIRDAAKDGCSYIQTPEQTATMELNRSALMGVIARQDADESLGRLKALAKELGIWLHIGSMSFVSELDESKAVNRSILIDPAGEIVVTYDKIHMFDVDLEQGESYRESASFVAGSKAVTAQLPWGALGLSICYDLRFPHLYRTLTRQKDARILAIPAAFTQRTGEAHWHILLRARAIENGAFVIAAAQGGTHANGRKTFGHSLIIDPWGHILAEAGQEPCFIAADIDMTRADACRSAVPSLQHDRAFEFLV